MILTAVFSHWHRSQGGVEVELSDVDKPLATSCWGKIARSIPGFGDVSVRGDVLASDPDYVGLDVRANAFGASFQLSGLAGEFIGWVTW